MLCPHCGPQGHLEQTGFGTESEQFYCSTCQKRYIAFPLGNGEFTEPVPLRPADDHWTHLHDPKSHDPSSK